MASRPVPPARLAGDRLRAAAADRRRRRDATAVVERLAWKGRAAGQRHPVAGAAATAVRMAALASEVELAEQLGMPLADVTRAEAGRVPFGDLPPATGSRLLQLGVDLLALADLARAWDGGSPVDPVRR